MRILVHYVGAGSNPAEPSFYKLNTHTHLLQVIFHDCILNAWVIIFFAAGVGARVEPLGPSRAHLCQQTFSAFQFSVL